MSANGFPVLCYTRDANLASCMERAATPSINLRIAGDYATLVRFARQSGAAVTLIDLRTAADGADIKTLVEELKHHVLIVMGVPRSEPVIQAAALPVYAVEFLPLDFARLRTLLNQAGEYLALLEENRMLRRRQEMTATSAATNSGSPAEPGDPTLSARDLLRILQCLGDVDQMLDRLVEEVAGSLKFSRAGIVVREPSGEDYLLRSGWLLLEDTARMRFHADDPFVCWLSRHAHLVERSGLDRIHDPAESLMIRRVLDVLGAEAIVPLRARDGLLGWLFVGHHTTGAPLDRHQLEALVTVGDLITASLESALLYREVTIQKKKAESLLHALPTGIVFVGSDARIQWFSTAAAAILELAAQSVYNQPIERLGPRFANLTYRTQNGETKAAPVCWTDAGTQRPLQVDAHRLTDGNDSLGVLLIITDLTASRALKEEQDRVERDTFWNELSASMSHEIRNPLVAIKTFAQLLPERYNDSEFREEFSRMVNEEVGRLNGIIDQIDGFARCKDIERIPLDIRHPLQEAVQQAQKTFDPAGKVHIKQSIPDSLPEIVGDRNALGDGFYHLLSNAYESLPGYDEPRILVRADHTLGGKSPAMVMVQVEDNGRGIDASIREKIFSPFCTTKTRGMGLGLAIVQRTIVDHKGKLDIHSGDRGTTVTIMLPARANTESQP